MDWPQSQDYNLTTISTASLESLGVPIAADGRSLTAASAWPVSNLAIYIPVVVSEPSAVMLFLTMNQTSPSGNFDVGLYDDQGNLLISSGSTAASGTNQSIDTTDTSILPGNYYLAQSVDNTSHTAGAAVPLAGVAGAWGCLQQASAFPLPSTATFATMAQAYVPLLAFQLAG